MEQSLSWEVCRSAGIQEILCILWNPKVHHRIHKSPPPALSWAKSALNIDFNIIFPPMPRSSKWFLYLRLPRRNLLCTSVFPCLPNAAPIPFYLIQSQEKHLVRSTDRLGANKARVVNKFLWRKENATSLRQSWLRLKVYFRDYSHELKCLLTISITIISVVLLKILKKSSESKFQKHSQNFFFCCFFCCCWGFLPCRKISEQ